MHTLSCSVHPSLADYHSPHLYIKVTALYITYEVHYEKRHMFLYTSSVLQFVSTDFLDQLYPVYLLFRIATRSLSQVVKTET
jgi:hypothetical protein